MSSSLHDLIFYGEPPQEPVPPPPVQEKKRTSRKRKLPANDDDQTSVIDHHELSNTVPRIVQRMNLLYNQSATTISADDAYWQELQASLNPPVASNKEKPPQMMTLERQAKLERKIEWRIIRKQWKTRQTNYRDEADVGGVLQQVFMQTSNNTTTPPNDEVEEEPKGSPELEIIVDTSDEEEETILRQLTQASGESEKKKKRKLEEERIQKNDIFIPFQDKMNYYERGLTHPDDLDPLRQYKQQKRAVAQQLPRNRTKYSDHPGDAITLRRLRVAHRRKEQESTFPPLNHNLYTSSQFAHKRQVLRLAARCLLSNGRQRGPLLSRLLHCLWSADSLDSTHASLVRRLANESAMRHQMFWSYLWKNRSEMTETLGISKELQVAGPYVGYRIDPRGFAKRKEVMAKLKKDKSLRAISVGSEKSKRGRASKKQDAGLLSTVSYAFIPGTIPPVPQHPLDESGVVLGPPDKFSNYVLKRVAIDASTLTLTSAHLLAIFAASIKANASPEEICIQVQSMFQKAIDLNRKIANFSTTSSAECDFPLPHVYRSWMGYLSFVMNGLLCLVEDEPESDFTFNYGQSIGNSFLDDASSTYSSVKDTAAEFYELYQQGGQSIGLQRFGDYHVVNALLRIAKDLPESAARLLSQPSEETSDRMPFELMHSVLVHLEQGGMLTEKTTSKNSVSVVELEYAMHQASQILLKCVERDPTDLKFHCWHLATLSSSLLLCSGNQIGSGPSLEPSSGHENGGPGVRQSLLKFQETRRETARALYLLLQLASKQQTQTQLALSSDVHLAVVTFLEWHEVVALLIGSPCREDKIQALETIHKYHSQIWAYSCVDTCQELSAQAEDRSVRIEAAARALEQDPSCKQNWRVLALELGPVGCRPSALDLMNKPFCVKNDCADCCILVEDSFIDHDQEKSDGESSNWWGRDRKKWWQFCVFDLKNPPRYAFWLISRSSFLKSIEMGLSSVSAHQPVSRWAEKGPDATTLDKLYDILTDVDSKHSEDHLIVSGTVNQYLPRSLRETISQEEEHNKEKQPFRAFPPGADDDLLEVECYQIIVASHLYGPGHRWVQSKVLQVADKSWDRKGDSIRQDSNEWAAVKWLYQMGISATNAAKMAVKLHSQKQTAKK